MKKQILFALTLLFTAAYSHAFPSFNPADIDDKIVKAGKAVEKAVKNVDVGNKKSVIKDILVKDQIVCPKEEPTAAYQTPVFEITFSLEKKKDDRNCGMLVYFIHGPKNVVNSIKVEPELVNSKDQYMESIGKTPNGQDNDPHSIINIYAQIEYKNTTKKVFVAEAEAIDFSLAKQKTPEMTEDNQYVCDHCGRNNIQ